MNLYLLEPDSSYSESVAGETTLTMSMRKRHYDGVEYWRSIEHDRLCWYDTCHRDHWKLRGLKTLHHVDKAEECERRLRKIRTNDQIHYLTCRDKFGSTALHTAAWNNRLAVVELIIRSADCLTRDSVIFCIDNYGETPLHQARSSEMVNLLLTHLSPCLRQQFIRHGNALGLPGAHHYARLYHSHRVMMELLLHSDETTVRHLLSYRDSEGYSLLLHACHSGDRQTVRMLLDAMSTCDYYDDTVMTVSHHGDTVIHTFIVRQWVEEIIEVLKPLTLTTRRNLSAVENKSGYSAYQLALIAPRLIRESGPSGYLFINRACIPIFEVNNTLLSIIHLLTNEYCITSLASIIQCQLTTKLSLSHLQLNTETSTGTVSVLQVYIYTF